MTAATNPPPPGRGVRWRRRLAYVPLALLVIASIILLILGSRASAIQQQNQNNYPVPSAAAPASLDTVAATCQPPVDSAAQEPWLEGDGSAETEWQSHAEEIGRDYLVGPEGWIFWSDYVEGYASQAVGRTTLNVEQLQNWVSYYGSIRDSLENQGIEFSIIVTPSTSSIYPEQLPTWMQPLRGSTIMDQFMAMASGLPVVDLRQDLIEAKTPDVNLFSWSNSHWTDYGGYQGWKQIAACDNVMYPDGPQLRVPKTSGFTILGDFNEWASYGVQSPGEDWAAPVFTEPLQDVTYTDKDGVTATVAGSTPIDAGWLPVTTSVDQSWTGKSALILRDSMGSAISPYWDQAYSSTRQIYHQWGGFDKFPDYPALVAEYKPDVVILQLAERHLVNAPPFGASY